MKYPLSTDSPQQTCVPWNISPALTVSTVPIFQVSVTSRSFSELQIHKTNAFLDIFTWMMPRLLRFNRSKRECTLFISQALPPPELTIPEPWKSFFLPVMVSCMEPIFESRRFCFPHILKLASSSPLAQPLSRQT